MVTIIVAAPAAIVTTILGDDSGGTNQSNWVLLAFVFVITAYLLGGMLAGRAVPSTPFIHGAAAPFLGFFVIQAVGIVKRLASGESISIAGLVFNGLLAASVGIIGGWFGARWATRTLIDGGGEPTG